MTSRFLFGFYLVVFGIMMSGCSSVAWDHQKSIAGFYDQMAEKIIAREPLIFAVYAGLWNDGKPPESNYHWGSKYGIYSMFDRAGNDPHIRQNYTHHQWTKIKFQKQANDPVRLAVFENEIQPNDFWKAKGVYSPFKIYVAFMAYTDLQDAGSDLVQNLEKSQAPIFTLDNGIKLDLGGAVAAGYNGHNYYYDISRRMRSLGMVPKVKKMPAETKGVFVICCHSKNEYRQDFVDENLYALAFTTSRMAPEGYNLLALFDGIAQGLDGGQLKDKMDKGYRLFQVMGGQSTPGPLFVNHEVGLF